MIEAPATGAIVELADETVPLIKRKAKRLTTSCGECRRRKQKCDQRQPCNNCSRRFPQPPCEYSSRRQSAPKIEVSLRPGTRGDACADAAAHLSPPTAGLDILQPEQPTPKALPSPATSEASKGAFEDETTGAVVVPEAAAELDCLLYQSKLMGVTQGVCSLPVAPTRQNAMLISAYSSLFGYFKGTFDGLADSDNPFVTQFVPLCIQSPLIVAVSLYVSARSLAENKLMDERTVIQMRGRAISQLNRRLGSKMDLGSDEVMGAVVQFTSIDWYFGGPRTVQAHLRGYKELVRIRQGFPSQGMGALSSKLVLVNDATIAFWLESEAIMKRTADFDYDFSRPPAEHFKVGFNSPLGSSSVSFMSCEDALGIHPATASILDEMRFLISLALQGLPGPTQAQESKITATGRWILDRVRRLDPEVAGALAERDQGEDTEFDERFVERLSSTGAKPHSLLPEIPSYHSSPVGSTRVGSTTDDESPARMSPASSWGSPDGLQPPMEHVQQMWEGDGGGEGAECEVNGRPVQADPLYMCVRRAAILYARAIAERRPMSQACLPSEALALLSATWQIPLSRWHKVVGIMIFVLSSILPAMARVELRRDGNTRETETETEEQGNGVRLSPKEENATAQLIPHHNFVKSVVQIGLMQVAVDDWGLCKEMTQRALDLQKWLGRRER